MLTWSKAEYLGGDSIERSKVTIGRKPLKMAAARLVFWFLGRGFQAAAKHDSRIRQEVAEWSPDCSIMLKINPRGPVMTVQKLAGELKYMGSSQPQDPDLAIYFKNIEGAIPVLTGQKGLAQAYAEHRFTLKGDIGLGMSVVRCMYLLETYLFPKFITRKILKRVPQKEVSSLKIYLATLFG